MLPLRTDQPAALLGEPAEQLHVPRLLESTSSGTVRNACDVCHKTFSKRFDLLQHRRRHTGEKPFQCPVCGRCFTQKSNLKRHIESHRVWPGGARQTLPADPALAGHHHCRHCQQTFRGYGRFKSHLRQHDQIKVYRCPQPSCGVTCAEQQRFLEHLRHHHAHLEFACHVCGQVFASLGTLSGHVAERHSSATDSDDVTAGSSFRCSDRYVCSRCQNRYCSLSALEHHLHTSSHNFTCKLCAKVFNSERFLRRHLLTHSSTARFSCNKCAKAFNTQGYLRAHMNTHNEQRQFCCDTCKKRFKRRDQLRRHQMIHSDKRLLCPFHAHSGCSRTFSRSDKLNLHVVTHAAARHKCKTCGKLYSRQDAMAKHSKRCVLPLPCATCGKEVDAADSSDHACAGTDKSPADLQPPACHAAGLDRPPDCDVIGHVTQPLECDVIITEDGDGRRPERCASPASAARSGCVDSPLVLYVPVLGDGARMELVSALTILGAADIGADSGHVSLEDSVMAAESVDVVISEVGDSVT